MRSIEETIFTFFILGIAIDNVINYYLCKTCSYKQRCNNEVK
jgi:hypothetical protein